MSTVREKKIHFINDNRNNIVTQIKLGLTLISIAFGVLFIAIKLDHLIYNDSILLLIPVVLIFIITYVGIAYLRIWQKGLDLLEPPVYISLWVAIFYGLPLFLWVLDLNSIQVSQLLSDDPLYWLALSAAYTALGLVFMWFGYSLATRLYKITNDSSPINTPKLNVNLAIVLYIIGILLRLFLYTYGLRGNASAWRAYAYGGSPTLLIDQWIDVIVKCLTASGFALFYFTLYKSPKRIPGWIIVIVVTEILLGILSGSRGGVIITAIYFFSFYRYARREIPYKSIIPLAAIAAIISIPMINALRSTTWGIDMVGPYDFIRGFQSSVASTTEMSVDEIVDESTDVIINRQMNVFQTQTMMIRLHPNALPYEGIERLILFPVLLIPRAIWPNKPIVSDGLATTSLYTMSSGAVFSSITLVGDLHRMAGWPMIMVGMLILGAIQGFLYKSLVGSGRIITLVFFSTFVFYLTSWEYNLPGLLLTLCRQGVMTWIFLTLILFKRVK